LRARSDPTRSDSQPGVAFFLRIFWASLSTSPARLSSPHSASTVGPRVTADQISGIVEGGVAGPDPWEPETLTGLDGNSRTLTFVR